MNRSIISKVIIIFIIFIISSCSTMKTSKVQFTGIEEKLKIRDYAGAISQIESAKDKYYKPKEKVVYYLDLGMLYHYHKEYYLNQQSYGPVINWLKKYARKDEVVFASWEKSLLIPAYTSLNAFSSSASAAYYFVPNNYLEEALFLNYRLDGLKAENALKEFFKNRRTISNLIYAETYRKKFGSYELISDEKLDYLVSKYKEFLSLPLLSILERYNIKYLIWNTEEQPNWQLDQYPFLKQIYQENRIKIYLIKKE